MGVYHLYIAITWFLSIAAMIFGIAYVIKKGSFILGFLLTWALLFIIGFLSLTLAGILHLENEVDNPVVEGLIGGFIYGLIIAGFGILVKNIKKNSKGSS